MFYRKFNFISLFSGYMSPSDFSTNKITSFQLRKMNG